MYSVRTLQYIVRCSFVCLMSLRLLDICEGVQRTKSDYRIPLHDGSRLSPDRIGLPQN